MKNHRYHELDAMRAIAALGVICWHYVNTYQAAPFGHVLAPFYKRGLLMVDFFFVLSGFVLARAFWTEARQSMLLANIRARIARIYPLHFVTLCLVGAMQWYLVHTMRQAPFAYQINDLYHFALNATLLNCSGLQRGFSFNAPSWSISTEFLVNLLFLAVISGPRRWVRPLLAVALAAAIATMAYRGVINGRPAFGWIDNDLVRTVAGFFIGVLTFRISESLGTQGSERRWDVVAGMLSIAAFWYLSSGHWSNVGDMVLCYAIYPALIISIIRSGLIRSALRVRPMVYLGEISYSIYLVHFPLLLAIHLWSTGTGKAIPGDSRVYFIAYLASVVLLASATYRWIETPGGRWLRSAPIPQKEDAPIGA